MKIYSINTIPITTISKPKALSVLFLNKVFRMHRSVLNQIVANLLLSKEAIKIRRRPKRLFNLLIQKNRTTVQLTYNRDLDPQQPIIQNN